MHTFFFGVLGEGDLGRRGRRDAGHDGPQGGQRGPGAQAVAVLVVGDPALDHQHHGVPRIPQDLDCHCVVHVLEGYAVHGQYPVVDSSITKKTCFK